MRIIWITIQLMDPIRFDWIIIMADYDMFSMETVKHETSRAMCGHTIASQRKFVWFVIWTSQIYLTFVVRYRNRNGCLCRIVDVVIGTGRCAYERLSSVAKTSIFVVKISNRIRVAMIISVRHFELVIKNARTGTTDVPNSYILSRKRNKKKTQNRSNNCSTNLDSITRSSYKILNVERVNCLRKCVQISSSFMTRPPAVLETRLSNDLNSVSQVISQNNKVIYRRFPSQKSFRRPQTRKLT